MTLILKRALIHIPNLIDLYFTYEVPGQNPTLGTIIYQEID